MYGTVVWLFLGFSIEKRLFGLGLELFDTPSQKITPQTSALSKIKKTCWNISFPKNFFVFYLIKFTKFKPFKVTKNTS